MVGGRPLGLSRAEERTAPKTASALTVPPQTQCPQGTPVEPSVDRRFKAHGLVMSRRGFVSAGAAWPLVLAAGTRFAAPVSAQDQSPQEPVAPGTGTLYFAETGHNLAEPFRTRWQAAGGADVIGLPLSEERYAAGAGGVLQTFENMTLVFDPGQPAPFDVRGQRFDKTLWLSLAPREAFSPVPGAPPEWGHTLSGELAEFWSAFGGEALFGRPLTESFRDPATGSRLQLFENALLEDTGGVVRLRPLGRQLAEDAGLLASDPAFSPAPPTGGQTFLVSSAEGLRLRFAPSTTAEMVTLLGNNAEFIAAPGWSGEWAPGFADGYSGYVSTGSLVEQPPLPQLARSEWDPSKWQGASLGETNVRSEPTTSSRIVKTLAYGDPVTVTAWVKGEEVYVGADLWAQLEDGTYAYSRNVGRNAPVEALPPPADAPQTGRWIDVNLTQQFATAYEATDPLRTVPVTTGMAGWETPAGKFAILNRVANETMTSGAIGAENHYRLEDVLFTQYFTDRGHALHFAWWRTKETIGRPGSHGCVNLLLEDARFFWDFADYGTPVLCHY
jgi:hypothetical protein